MKKYNTTSETLHCTLHLRDHCTFWRVAFHSMTHSMMEKKLWFWNVTWNAHDYFRDNTSLMKKCFILHFSISFVSNWKLWWKVVRVKLHSAIEVNLRKSSLNLEKLLLQVQHLSQILQLTRILVKGRLRVILCNYDPAGSLLSCWPHWFSLSHGPPDVNQEVIRGKAEKL